MDPKPPLFAAHLQAQVLVDTVLEHHPDTRHIQTSYPDPGTARYSFGTHGSVSGPSDHPGTYARALAKACAIYHGYDRLPPGNVRTALDKLCTGDPCHTRHALYAVYNTLPGIDRRIARALQPTLTEAEVDQFLDHVADAVQLESDRLAEDHPRPYLDMDGAL